MTGDLHWANVVYLNHFNGEDGATVSPDVSQSEHDATFIGSAALSTESPIFGSACVDLSASADDSVQSPDSSDWFFAGGEFTIELSIKVSTFGPGETNVYISQWITTGNQRGWLLFSGTGKNRLAFQYSTTGSDTVTLEADGNGMSVDTWHQIAVDKDSSDFIRLYVDGVMADKELAIGDLFDSNYIMRIGAGSFSNLEGIADEVRITKGVARYASDSGYTPLNEEFPNGPIIPAVPLPRITLTRDARIKTLTRKIF